MSTWNHRVLAHDHKGEIFFQIHEVYYDDNEKPNGYTKDAVSIGGDKYSEIQWQISKIQECLTKPVLDAGSFPDEYDGNFLTN